MAQLIDNYKFNQTEYLVGGAPIRVIVKPSNDENKHWFERLKDAIGVLTGKYQAVYFFKDMNQNPTNYKVKR